MKILDLLLSLYVVDTLAASIGGLLYRHSHHPHQEFFFEIFLFLVYFDAER
jgi:hypothetical protein